MLRFTVSYRKTAYFVDLNQSKIVLDLKKSISDLTGIKPERFTLQAKDTVLLDSDQLRQYRKDVNNIEMVNAIITVRVILDGRSFTYSIGEQRSVEDFIGDILKLSKHSGNISLHCDGVSLDDTCSLVTNGIKHGSYLTAVDGRLIREIEQPVTIKFRTNAYQANVNISKMVTHLKEIASEESGVKVDQFSLRLGDLTLVDSKPISRYITSGSTFTMTNVCINITVTLNKKQYAMLVSEDRRIEDFKEDVIARAEYNSDVCLFYNNKKLQADDTLVTGGVEPNACLTAMREVIAFKDVITSDMKMVTVEYRTTSYAINIAPSKTVGELKDIIYGITDIIPENFCLKIDKILLKDNKIIAKYISTNETIFTMTNVTIKVLVNFSGKLLYFSVLEMMNIYDFKKEIIKKTGCSTDLSLTCNGQKLVDKETFVSSEVEHNASIVALSIIIGG